MFSPKKLLGSLLADHVVELLELSAGNVGTDFVAKGFGCADHFVALQEALFCSIESHGASHVTNPSLPSLGDFCGLFCFLLLCLGLAFLGSLLLAHGRSLGFRRNLLHFLSLLNL